MNRFVLRNENFGYTLFDRKKMRHRFLKENELGDIEKQLGPLEKWDADLNFAPEGIIFSPIRIYYELTSRCNLHCKTCFNSSGKPHPNELSTQELKNVIAGLRRDLVFDIRFSGGEVTQRDDWYEILGHAKDLGFAVSVNTNGVYKDPDKTIAQLVDLDLEQITFSIDGDSEFHDFIRGKGNYDRTVDSMKRLHEHDTHLRINTVLTKGSDKAMENILELAGQYCEEINFFYMRTAGRALGILDQVETFEELDQFNYKIEKQKAKYPHVNILHGSKVMVDNSITTNINDKVNIQMGGPDGFTRFNILPDGSVWPGGYTPHLRPDFYLGNVVKEGYTILDIWRNNERLNEFRKISLDLQKKCLGCEEKNVRCPGASMEMEFYRELNPEQKNPYCIK